MRRSLLALLLLTACATPVRVPLYINAHVDTQEIRDLATLAVSPFGLEPDFRASGKGAITVLLIDGEINEYAAGKTPKQCQRPCGRLVISDYEARNLGHEIGHALGLWHHKDPENLMHAPSGEQMWLTDWQQAIAYDTAQRLEACAQ